jgi:stress-induced morphogen
MIESSLLPHSTLIVGRIEPNGEELLPCTKHVELRIPRHCFNGQRSIKRSQVVNAFVEAR